MKTVSLVIPFYNEEAALAHTFRAIETELKTLPYRFEIIAINDGSTDGTLKALKDVNSAFSVTIIDLSRNFGKEAALSAGLFAATGDAVIPLDADLQDPPSLIAEMLAKWEEGYEVVVAQRVDRSSDSYLKRSSAASFYRIINKLSEVPIPENVGDFRLMDRCVVSTLNSLGESRRFMKGLFAWAGFRAATVTYARPERQHGNTKFNGWRLWNLAVEGITSFSTVPLRVWTYIGFVVSVLSVLYAGFIMIKTLWLGVDVPGYASLMCSILLMSGLQLMGLGVLGEYLGRTYIESKRRPTYIIRETTVMPARDSSHPHGQVT